MKVLLKLFQKLATGCGEIPPQRGGNVAERQKGTARVAGEEPPQAKRNAKRSPKKLSEQRGRTIRWMVRPNAFADPRGTRLSLDAPAVGKTRRAS